jgi:hypothetical protein
MLRFFLRLWRSVSPPRVRQDRAAAIEAAKRRHPSNYGRAA